MLLVAFVMPDDLYCKINMLHSCVAPNFVDLRTFLARRAKSCTMEGRDLEGCGGALQRAHTGSLKRNRSTLPDRKSGGLLRQTGLHSEGGVAACRFCGRMNLYVM